MVQISEVNTLSTLTSSFPYHEDRLSNLPNDVLNQILVCLPIRDLVRTSILSRKWRYAWSSIPDLIFNRDCRLDLIEEPGSSRLLSIVDHVLLLRTAPIRHFRISDYLNGYNEHVEKWITYLTRNGIEELYLLFDQRVRKIYKMSSCLFSCKQLKAFVVCCHELMVPQTFKDFMNLENIDLKVASISEASISHLVSCCPLLETLKLEYGNHLTHLKFSAVKLKSLRVKGFFNNIFLDDCAQLTDCKIFLRGLDVAVKNEFANIYNLEKVLGCLPLLEELQVEYYFLRADWVDDEVLSSDPCNWVDMECVFYQLKKFRMKSMNGKPPQMELLKFVLDNAPILETMYVVLNKEGKEDENQILKSLLLFHRASAVAEVVVVEE